jgi:hypothetical protein
MNNLNDEWDNFLEFKNNDDNDDNNIEELNTDFSNNMSIYNSTIPKPSPIYISTKTIISYVNSTVDLYNVFWLLPVLYYHEQKEGIIKKQIKVNSTSHEELDNLHKKISCDNYVEEHIINHIENPNGRIKFKDSRKISIGISKKDILSYRSKKKNAFYNCFVLILRVFINNIFKEIHIKVFNTGKLEIPGIQNNDLLYKSLELLIIILKCATNNYSLNYIKESESTVLINSNFNCGFYIDREKLFNILRFTYGINSCYDPCSYPGIQCEFYYDKNIKNNTGKQLNNTGKQLNNCNNINDNIIKISFMIFRTGSVLIVGKCDETILYYIYDYVKNLLQTEFLNIATKIIDVKPITKIKKNKKIYINISSIK